MEMASNPYVNKVVYGNDTVIDLTADTVSADKILSGYTAHDKSGAGITGSVPSVTTLTVNANNSNADYTESGVNKYVSNVKVKALRNIVNSGLKIQELKSNITASETDEKIVLRLNNSYYITLFANGNNIQLISYDSSSELSRITIATTGASYRETFTLVRIYLLAENLFLIQYYYATSATANSANIVRLIAIKSDYTLAQSGTANASAVSSATAEIEAWLIPTNDWSSYGMFYTSTNPSTGAVGIFTRLLYIDLDGLSLSVGGSSFTTIASSNTAVTCCGVSRTAKFGLFYQNSSGVKNLYVNLGRNTGAKGFSVDDVLEINTLNKPKIPSQITATTYGDAQILGTLPDGNLLVCEITYQIGSVSSNYDVKNIYVAYYLYVYKFDIVTPALVRFKFLRTFTYYHTPQITGANFIKYINNPNLNRFIYMNGILHDLGYVLTYAGSKKSYQIVKETNYETKYTLVELSGIVEKQLIGDLVPYVYNQPCDWFSGYF